VKASRDPFFAGSEEPEMASRASGARQNAAVQTSSSTPAAVIQRQCACGQHSGAGECDQCKKKRISLSRQAAGAGPVSVDSRVRSALESPGQPLEKETRSLMESRFHHDFSSVRVHTGTRAEESASALQANAYALGRDVVFGHGRYNPSSEDGLHLIAHELAHVVQQQHAPAPGPQTDLEVSEPGDAAEREAESAADRVAAGGEAGVHERAGAATVHRDLTSDQKTGLEVGGIIAGAGLAIFGLYELFSWLLEDGSDIKDPPKCGDPQMKVIKPAMAKAAAMVKKALEKIHAFQANPKAPENGDVQKRLMARFNSDAPETAARVERVVSQVGRQIAAVPKMECNTAKSDNTCSWADAYVPGDGSKVVFCAKFFSSGADPATIVHEMTHATTGGAHITDRGYQGERILPLLPTASTDEALTNAESYSEFVSDIVTGKTVEDPVPDDKIECPDALKDPLKLSVARAQRWTTNALNIFTSKNQDRKTELRVLLPPVIPAAKTDISHITDVFRKTNEAFSQSVHLVCQDAKNTACGQAPPVQFTAGDSTLNVCPAWQALDADHRIMSLLEGFYGVLGGETNATWRTGLATIAQAIANKDYAVPPHNQVVGDATWTPDALRIILRRDPKAATARDYEESQNTHTRLSNNLPVYAGAPCVASTLPLDFLVLFAVDTDAKPRPGPFTPPIVETNISFDGRGRADPDLNYHKSDSHTRYEKPNTALASQTKNTFNLIFAQNGTFHMNFRMNDPDSQTVLTYDDQIRVDPIQPCDAPTPNKKTRVASASTAGNSPGESPGEEA
jgi:uncharacterized protein DUF4157/lysine-specific metallo-endopeptidase family protein